MCEKVGYNSPKAARKAVRTMGNTIRVYRCPECHQVHTTKDRKKR